MKLEKSGLDVNKLKLIESAVTNSSMRVYDYPTNGSCS